MARESHLRSILKGLSWRFIATGILMAITFAVSGNISGLVTIGVLDFVLKFVIYYVHERFWAAYLKDREQTKQISFAKAILWRIIASLISLTVLWNHFQSGGTAGLIVTIEFFTKFIVYYIHERIWQLLPLGTVRNLPNIKRKKTTL